MPTTPEHKAKADQNEFFVSTLGNPFWDWAVAGTFYTALHYVEAYLATKKIHSPSHPVRDSHIQKDNTLKVIYADYRELKDESRAARYDVIPFTQDDVKRLQKNLAAVKNVVAPFI